MKSSQIRQKFLEYFEARGHHISPSASLVPADPTMLLTGAGMVPFKPIFMGKTKVDYTRAASIQKCVRTTDIEMIGRTGRHLSFFEMLGNFSFGDYYKKEAITWSWQLLTDVYKLDRERLWVSIFKTDDEAAEIWSREVGVVPERIVRLGEEENFWSAGPTGPCGPCSEILYDQGSELSCGKETCVPGCDCDRYLEIWNLVFMQYNRDDSGDLHTLPRKNIDTGMGLERIASVLQGVTSNYETDLLFPIIEGICEMASVKYGRNEKTDVSLKIIADHARAITFMIGDGIMPGNDGRGYILRRLIRRAVRHGRLLGVEKSFLALFIEKISGIMGDQYPEIAEKIDSIKAIATSEEERFSDTLRQGLMILSDTVKQIEEVGGREISGDAVFRLYDTYGFPLELTEEIAAESDLNIDKPGFENLMAEQRSRARANLTGAHSELYVSNVNHQLKEKIGQTEFIGYQEDQADAKITAISSGSQVKKEASKGDKIEVFLDRTPFYAEKGGQIGDMGVIATETGRVKVSNTTVPVADLVAHQGEVVEGTVKLGQSAKASIDKRRRLSISRNHTATHLLHWALRTVLGEHVKQAGSLVQADRFRFDFSHHEPLSEDQLMKIEKLTNEKILQNQSVRAFETTIDYAKETGALALFGEKYGQFVRLVEIGNFSKELCGGIHVHSSSEIGYIKVIGESGIGANTRRIEAITGKRFLDYVNSIVSDVDVLSDLFNTVPTQVVKAAQSVVDLLKQQESELAESRNVKLAGEVDRIAKQAEKLDGIILYMGQLDGADADSLRAMADRLRAKAEKAAVVLGSAKSGKALILVAATADLVEDGFSAVSMIKKVAPIIGGGGGGSSDLAQAGGKDIKNLTKIFPEAKKYLCNWHSESRAQADGGKAGIER